MEVRSNAERLLKLHQAVLTCQSCGLAATRTNAVPGTGPCPADIMIVGEAPGFNEDRQGRPFVGQAGKLLDTLLAGIGLEREDVYITNVLKCRPPQNRDPMPNEAEACAPYLAWQLKLVAPKVVIVLGRHALERLLPGLGPISRVRGQMVEREGVSYVPVYHPAAALHNGSLLGDLKADFEKVGEYVRSVVPPAMINPGAQAGLAVREVGPHEPPPGAPPQGARGEPGPDRQGSSGPGQPEQLTLI